MPTGHGLVERGPAHARHTRPVFGRPLPGGGAHQHSPISLGSARQSAGAGFCPGGICRPASFRRSRGIRSAGGATPARARNPPTFGIVSLRVRGRSPGNLGPIPGQQHDGTSNGPGRRWKPGGYSECGGPCLRDLRQRGRTDVRGGGGLGVRRDLLRNFRLPSGIGAGTEFPRPASATTLPGGKSTWATATLKTLR